MMPTVAVKMNISDWICAQHSTAGQAYSGCPLSQHDGSTRILATLRIEGGH